MEKSKLKSEKWKSKKCKQTVSSQIQKRLINIKNKITEKD